LRATDKIVEGGDPRWSCTREEYAVILERFHEYMRDLDTNIKVFITSDDDRVYEQYKDMYKDRIAVEHSGDPITDFFTLSKCAKIIQVTKHSTYSLVAAVIGGRELVNFADNLPNSEVFTLNKFRGLIDNVRSCTSHDTPGFAIVASKAVNAPVL
jgi:hypothetical protein